MNYNLIKADLRKLTLFDRLGYYLLLTIGTIVTPLLVSVVIFPLTTSGFDKVIGYIVLIGVFLTNILFAQIFIRVAIGTNTIIGCLAALVTCGLTYLISTMIISGTGIIASMIGTSLFCWELIYHLLRRRMTA